MLVVHRGKSYVGIAGCYGNFDFTQGKPGEVPTEIDDRYAFRGYSTAFGSVNL